MTLDINMSCRLLKKVCGKRKQNSCSINDFVNGSTCMIYYLRSLQTNFVRSGQSRLSAWERDWCRISRIHSSSSPSLGMYSIPPRKHQSDLAEWKADLQQRTNGLVGR